METYAKHNTAMIKPRLARMTMDLIRGKDVETARGILENTNTKASSLILKVLNSAVANAENNMGLNKDDLVVVEAYANQGPSFKRVAFRGRGGVDTIIKRTCHITIVLDSKNK